MSSKRAEKILEDCDLNILTLQEKPINLPEHCLKPLKKLYFHAFSYVFKNIEAEQVVDLIRCEAERPSLLNEVLTSEVKEKVKEVKKLNEEALEALKSQLPN
jgi:flagellar biosynthesis regulator FlbT